jgi:hypothetical protein
LWFIQACFAFRIQNSTSGTIILVLSFVFIVQLSLPDQCLQSCGVINILSTIIMDFNCIKVMLKRSIACKKLEIFVSVYLSLSYRIASAQGASKYCFVIHFHCLSLFHVWSVLGCLTPLFLLLIWNSGIVFAWLFIQFMSWYVQFDLWSINWSTAQVTYV